MIQYQLKLRLNTRQEKTLHDWLWMLTGVWNWAVLKISRDAADKIYDTPKDFQNLLAHHGEKMGVPSHTLPGMLSLAHQSWKRCFKKLAKKPRLKGKGNRLNSIPFPDPIGSPKDHRISIPGIGKVRYHKMALPEGQVKCGRIVRRASGWYLCLFIYAEPKAIPPTGDGQIGSDPGFPSLLTVSNGEVIDHPRELEALARRLAAAQRGHDQVLARRIQERIANQRKDRNHKLSRRLVRENSVIRFSADHHKGMAKRFGKSVSSSGHGQLRPMLSYKCRAGGRAYDEPEATFSTMRCSNCGGLHGPTGFSGLAVRQWRCPQCGTLDNRDVNAARNTLRAGTGAVHEESYVST